MNDVDDRSCFDVNKINYSGGLALAHRLLCEIVVLLYVKYGRDEQRR